MALFDTLLTPTDENASATLYAFLLALRVNVTQATVRESLEQHPDFPSLLSLSDVLTDWQVENTGLQLNTPEQLRELPLPFMAHLTKKGGWYVLVTALQGDRITYTDNAAGRKTESLTDFETNWSGVVLLAEATDQSGEADYVSKRKLEILKNLHGPFILTAALLIITFVILGDVGSSLSKHLSLPDWFLLSTKSLGLAVSGLLVAKQLGSKNALTDRLCRINSKTNCDDVLNSPAAKLWGWLSWADIGLLYFSGSLLTMMLAAILPDVVSAATRPLLYGLALFALPYTLFSVYYQARVVRQWCSLCLGIQVLLLSEGLLSAIQAGSLPTFATPYLLMLTAFLLPVLAWVLVKPLLINAQKSHREHQELMRLKRDPDLFQAMLMKQLQMPAIPTDLHPIVLGNPEAEHTITVVTNPYCGPCARIHKEVEQLLNRNSNLKAKIIFTCDGEEGLTTQVAVHLMALAEQGNVAMALTDWYEQPEKNFDAWAKKYPVPANQMDWLSTANQQADWCMLAGISATPTIHVDGYRLPELYQLKGLRWLINTLEPVATGLSISI